jgi:hypothetical protein
MPENQQNIEIIDDPQQLDFPLVMFRHLDRVNSILAQKGVWPNGPLGWLDTLNSSILGLDALVTPYADDEFEKSMKKIENTELKNFTEKIEAIRYEDEDAWGWEKVSRIPPGKYNQLHYEYQYNLAILRFKCIMRLLAKKGVVMPKHIEEYADGGTD